MIKYKISIEIENTDSEGMHPAPRKIQYVYDGCWDKNSGSASIFWCLGQDIADAIDAVSNILYPPFEDFIEGVRDGLIDKSDVWIKEETR
jgi:hypothetical protein